MRFYRNQIFSVDQDGRCLVNRKGTTPIPEKCNRYAMATEISLREGFSFRLGLLVA